MKATGRKEVSAGLAPNWRACGDMACAVGRARRGRRSRSGDLRAGARTRRPVPVGYAAGPLAVFDSRSIWLNELRSRRVREGGGFVDASEALVFDGGGMR